MMKKYIHQAAATIRSNRIALVAAVIAFMVPLHVHAQKLDVPYVGTPPEVVDKMLEAANVGPGDYVIDLGCGDGRIVIAAAEKGAFGHGVDLDPERLEEARINATEAGVTDKVMFLKEDIFKTDFSRADVITMYLLSTVNRRLRPKLLNKLEPGTRVVSHNFDMGDWQPDKYFRLDDSLPKVQDLTIDEQLELVHHEVFLWIVPAKAEGLWKWQTNGRSFTMEIQQKFQQIHAEIISGNTRLTISNPRLVGKKISFTASDPKNGVHYAFNGRIRGNKIVGNVQIHGHKMKTINEWSARRSL